MDYGRVDVTAVVWKITPLFADWIASPANTLFKNAILAPDSTVLELGCGVSGIVALTLAPAIQRYIATDQGYVLKLLRENIAENAVTSGSRTARGSKSKSKNREQPKQLGSNIDITTLDWETDIPSLPSNGVDAVIACDCIYNDALIDPFVTTCVDICKLRVQGKPTVCIIAQQLRSADVMESWLRAFYSHFRVWRMPDELLTPGLREDTGFVVHLGVLRQAVVKEGE